MIASLSSPPCRWLLAAGALFLSASMEAALPAGTGEFSFTRSCNGESITVHYVKSASYRPEDPPVMVLHGMLRNADVYRDAWIDLAAQHGLFVVVPHFTAETYPGPNGYNLGNVFQSEEDLTRNPECLWSYRIPEELFAFLKRQSKDTLAAGYLAFGHSAGSQFLHRLIAFRPDRRLLLAVAANAGWYTFPTLEATWPYGLAETGFQEADFPAYLASNLFLLLGEADNDPNHSSLRRAPEAMLQGRHRLERGERFYAAGKALAQARQLPFGWQLQTVPGVDHDNARMAPPAARIMAAYIETLKRPNPTPPKGE